MEPAKLSGFEWPASLSADPPQLDQTAADSCTSATMHRVQILSPHSTPGASYRVVRALPARPRALLRGRHPRPSQPQSAPPVWRRRPPPRPGPRRRLQTNETSDQARGMFRCLTRTAHPAPRCTPAEEVSRGMGTRLLHLLRAMQPLQHAGALSCLCWGCMRNRFV